MVKDINIQSNQTQTLHIDITTTLSTYLGKVSLSSAYGLYSYGSPGRLTTNHKFSHTMEPRSKYCNTKPYKTSTMKHNGML